MSEKLFTPHDSNSQYNILNELKLILLKDRDNLSERVVRAEKLLSAFSNIFATKHTGRVFIYLLERGACTSYILQVHLDISVANTYRCLRRLEKLGFSHQIRRIPKHLNKKGGPRPFVWALTGATTNDIASAIQLHYRSQSPKYRVAEELASTFLTDYIFKRGIDEIGYSELRDYVRTHNLPFVTSDIAEIAADYLTEQGVKVWR